MNTILKKIVLSLSILPLAFLFNNLTPLIDSNLPFEFKTGPLTITGVKSKALNGELVYEFKGIPYAEAPIGNKRWTRTEIINLPNKGPVDASKFGPACPHQVLPNQYDGQSNFDTQALINSMSEDCLYLNIWRPANVPSGKVLPVLFIIHGGGFVRGTSSDPKENGTELASRNVVVVSIDYRLGALGFFNHSSFKQNNFWGDTNFGLLDQVQAMRWVKYNIGKFNGDINNITLIGGSAGGASVYYHLSSNISKYYYNKGTPLFHKAIAVAGGGIAGIFPAIKTTTNSFSAQKNSENFINWLKKDPSKKCSDQAHENIRGKSYIELLNSNQPLATIVRQCPTIEQINAFFGFKLKDDSEEIEKGEFRSYPYVDNATVIDNGPLSIANKENGFLPIPLLNGAAKDEASVLDVLQKNPISSICWMRNNNLSRINDAELIKKLAIMYQLNDSTLVQQNQSFLNTHLIRKFYSDGTFNQPANYIAKKQNQKVGSYSYLYAYKPVEYTNWRRTQYKNNHPDINTQYKLREYLNNAGHTSELFAFFGNMKEATSNTHQIDVNFSNRTQDYLVNFMTSGDPNNGPYRGLPLWNKNIDGQTVMHLGLQWNPDDVFLKDLRKPMSFDISIMNNHKSEIFEYFKNDFEYILKNTTTGRCL
jgi:carboxylesterase type B